MRIADCRLPIADWVRRVAVSPLLLLITAHCLLMTGCFRSSNEVPQNGNSTLMTHSASTPAVSASTVPAAVAAATVPAVIIEVRVDADGDVDVVLSQVHGRDLDRLPGCLSRGDDPSPVQAGQR